MTARRLLPVLLVLLSGCGVLSESIGTAPRYALVLVNNTQESRFWSVEQPDGAWSRFEVQPCSSASHDLGATQRWEVEWGATIAASSDEVELLNEPFTLVEVLFRPDGVIDVAPVRGVREPPDAPLEPLTCAGR